MANQQLNGSDVFISRLTLLNVLLFSILLSTFFLSHVEAASDFEVTSNTSIPDNLCPSYTDVSIPVSDSLIIQDINVGLTITHTYRSDLVVRLTSPAGTILSLFSYIGGSGENLDVLLDDDAVNDIGSMGSSYYQNTASPYYDTSFNPQGSSTLSAFNGEDAQGNWVLSICDDYGWDTGAVNRVLLQIEGTAATTLDYGDAPYTSTSYGNPSHEINETLYLGSGVSEEANGYDDIDAESDNDDGLVLPLAAISEADTGYTIASNEITATGSGTLHAWLDIDGSQSFDSDEYTSVSVSNGVLADDLSWTFADVMGSAETYLRLRLTTDLSVNALTPSSAAADGEVEDYKLSVVNFSVEPIVSACEAQGGTLSATNVFTALDNGTMGQGSGAQDESPASNPYLGIISGGIYDNYADMGWGEYAFISNIHTMRNSAQHDAIIHDPINGETGRFFAADPDEDTPRFTLSLTGLNAGKSYEVGFYVANSEYSTSSPNNEVAILMDDEQVYSTGELIPTQDTMIWHYHSFVYRLGSNTDLGMQIRSLNTGGSGNDFFLDEITVKECVLPKDYGDAPSSGTHYGEPFHTIGTDLYLGSAVSSDVSHYDTVNADGDQDDAFSGLLDNIATDASSYSITKESITAVGSGTLHAWIDFDGNQTFDSDEYAATSVSNGVLQSDLNWTYSDLTSAIYTYARFRLTTDGNINSGTATAVASDGEIEDYMVEIGSFDRVCETTVKLDWDSVDWLDGATSGSFDVGSNTFSIEFSSSASFVDSTPKDVNKHTNKSGSYGDGEELFIDTSTGGTMGIDISSNKDSYMFFSIYDLDIGEQATITAQNSLGQDIPIVVEAVNSESSNLTITGSGTSSVFVDSNGNNAAEDQNVNHFNIKTLAPIKQMSVVGDAAVDDWYLGVSDVTLCELSKEAGKLNLNKSVYPESAIAGDTVTYTLVLTNDASENATGVVVLDKLPSSVNYVSDDATGEYDQATGIWSVDLVPPNGSKVLNITVTVNE